MISSVRAAGGRTLSKKTADTPGLEDNSAVWARALEELKAEIAADPDLTEDEKRRLDELDKLSDDEWPLVTCSGKPISEMIIEDRGER